MTAPGPACGSTVSSHAGAITGKDGNKYIEIHHQGAVRWLPLVTTAGYNVMASVSEPEIEIDQVSKIRNSREESPISGVTTKIVEVSVQKSNPNTHPASLTLTLSPVTLTLIAQVYQKCNSDFNFSRDEKLLGHALTDPAVTLLP